MIKSVLKAEEKLWREVARRVVDEPQNYGLCSFVDYVDVVALEDHYARDRIQGYLGEAKWAYAQSTYEPCRGTEYSIAQLDACYAEHREARCLAALWMAEEAADEARSAT